MTPHEPSIIIMLRDIAENVGALKQTVEKQSADLRDHIRDDRESLERIHHCISSEIRPSLVDLRHLGSDVRELKTRQAATDDTSRTLALDAAKASVLLKRSDEEVERGHAARRDVVRSVMMIVVSIVITALVTRLVL
jgi:hypothetical protein